MNMPTIRLQTPPRCIPPVPYLLVLLLLACLLPMTVHAADPPGYREAVSNMTRLEANVRQRNQREPWEKLAQQFLNVYNSQKRWNNRPAALYRSALALDKLSRRASNKKDARNATERYALLVRQHPRSEYADDALLQAARLQYDIIGDERRSEALLRQQLRGYPSGRKAAEAKALLARVSRTATAEKKEEEKAPTKDVSGTAYRKTVKTILIDAGHGGKDPGTHHNGIVERELTLDISKRVGSILAAHGVRVRYTRFANTWLSLESRADKVRTNKADLFISIHVNANEKTSVQGFETYYLDVSRTTAASRLAAVENALRGRNAGGEKLPVTRLFNIQKQESKRLARSIHQTTLSHMRKKRFETRNGGIKAGPFHVLRRSGVPGVLLELGYCTNPKEAGWLGQSAYRSALARGIANGILNYMGKL